ncbi:MAG: LptE family protein [bacterium]|nr:LptE family protein [bacterium]
MKFSIALVFCFLIFLHIVSGCTYNFSGFTTRDIKSIAIPTFENHTVKYSIDEILTKSVISAFIQDNRLKLLDRKVADSILLGEILNYNRTPFSYDEHSNVKDYKIELTVKLTYKDKSGKTILEKELINWFLYSYDISEETGIEKLCSIVADDIIKGILEGWQ